ncbi:GspH/FimT family pseudopilin [Sinimarinibacterium sp. NLF-5-8]|uniref:GspH/FimT family pseudopilin n=1 Tax=Sinimarinibacterium sp. NLF-5-8 TaxID=2698684 RepID=UPI00137BE5E8|nr:GspH/FimT family pseudopilin [Sinimarinibacterium sp. NLF-5-8]QHS09189.1 prepilin-type N-terminal cleavage/methylation domain-containing protein [Sinimarinibacterium sp. NLF-5-8]
MSRSSPATAAPLTPRIHHRGHGGFTLLEAMITIAILAVVLAIAIPSFKSLTASRAVNSQLSALAGALRLTRAEAIKHGARVSICPNMACSGNQWKDGWIIFLDPTGTGAVTSANVLHQQPAFSNSGGIYFCGGKNRIAFKGNGLAGGGQSSFSIMPPLPSTDALYIKASQKLTVNSTGNTYATKEANPC